MVVISPCTQSFIKVMTNPFGSFNDLPCIPDVISIPSFRFSAKSRGIMTVGTAGTGFVALNPWLLVDSNPGSNANGTDFPVQYTTATYTAASAVNTYNGGAFPIGVFGAASNSFLTAATLALIGVQYRLVGAGIRIGYAGSLINRGGRILLWHLQGNANPAPTFSIAQALQDNFSRAVTEKGIEHGVCYQCDNPDLLGYYSFNGYQQSVAGNVNRTCMYLAVDGATAGNSYWFEAVGFFELIGTGMPLQGSESDPIGFAAAMAAKPTIVPNLPYGAVAERSFLSNVMKNLEEGSGRLITAAGNAGMSYLTGQLGRMTVNSLLPTISDVD
jgi:hypothetical protein